MQQRTESLRTLRKQDNRRKLIEATISLIAEEGISAVTVSRVVERAGVSRGLINLHFETKEAMMIEVMDSLNFEWRDAVRDTYNDTERPAAEVLMASMMVSLSPPIMESQKMAVWYCFYADPWYRKVYEERYFETDQETLEAIAGLIESMDREAGYGLGAPLIMARALRALTGGLWLELLTEPDKTNMEEARVAFKAILVRLFPKHYGPEASLA